MTKEAIQKEIALALMELGYGATRIHVHVKSVAPGRVQVEVNGEDLHIYDLDKHTFVD